MQNRATGLLLVLFVILLVAAGLYFFLGGETPISLNPQGREVGKDVPGAAATADLGAGGAAQPETTNLASRENAMAEVAPTGVRGIVLDSATGLPLGGIEVIAVKDEPSIEPLVARFRGLFQQGMFVETRAPRRELGRAISNADGTFEIKGLPSGRVFLDGRSDGWFVRTPGTARLAMGEMHDGIELRASPGGRVRGIVLGPDGAPAAGAVVNLRPGLNSFLGQLTERQYRWLETVTDAQGRFDLPGVPAGQGYTASASAEQIALEEVFGLEVRPSQVTEVTLRGHQGATVAGVVTNGDGQPVVGANVAMVYLDISRVLFSADGRSEPIVTDAQGRFRVEHVAAGRVAFVGAAQDLAPSNIEELAVVDGGVYEDLVLQLGEGATVRGMVIDDQKQPVAGAAVELRPFERPNDPQFLKMMLKIRRVLATTDAEGRFVAKGLTGERLVVQASKVGYTTAMKFGVKLDEPNLTVEVQRGVVIRGKVMEGDVPLQRFRVDTRSREIPKPEEKGGDAAVADAGGRGRRARASTDGNSGATWNNDGNDNGGGGGARMRFGRGGGMQTGTVQMAEGQTMMDRGMDGNWREIQTADGTFELRGIPPGRVRVRVRADGFLDAKEQEIDLLPGAVSEVLLFKIEPGQPVSGVVLDEATGKPVSDAQVTAYKQREGGNRRAGMFSVDIDPEDFDFLALSSAQGRRSAISDSKGHFTIASLEPGKYRFTARHPDKAKSSNKDVDVVAGKPTPDIEIRIDAGGGVEGNVTGLGMRPLADAFMVAFSIQAGTMRSSTTDKSGYYRIDGLPPGQYLVFKSRMDERADNIPLELMSNMRLKTVTVKQGKFARLDVHDDSEDGVRVSGIVREGGAPVPRALVTLLGSDRDGLLGMGVRANAAGMDGRYELIGIKPGNYVMQVSRFQGQPVQTTFEIEVPGESREFAFDIQLPTSEVAGRVIDTRGAPVVGVMVSLGSEEGGLSGADGLIGLIAQNGLSQARTNNDGEFRMRSVAQGTYKLTAGSRFGPGGGRRGGGEANADGERVVHGEGSLGGVVVDGMSKLEGLVVTVPIAGRITGLVLDGSGNPVQGAEIAYTETSQKRRKQGNPLLDLIGAQSRPIRSGADGRFEIPGLTPGVYDLRVESEALEAGKASDLRVAEDAATDVVLRMVRGATLKVRATNVDKQLIPFANLTLLDGNGKPVVNRLSTLSVMKRLMGSKDEVADSGWYTFGSVPPDTYTAVITEQGKPELRITRTIRDGETVEWDVDVAAELEQRDRDAKK
ncbi:MAG: carboxypeptidase regulatory-like domain-containing protein [Planctomycetes bacterium]|nr:carboxypeptidase regulatory-like domain-containing protein [Planctomycetota bacterium]